MFSKNRFILIVKRVYKNHGRYGKNLILLCHANRDVERGSSIFESFYLLSTFLYFLKSSGTRMGVDSVSFSYYSSPYYHISTCPSS